MGLPIQGNSPNGQASDILLLPYTSSICKKGRIIITHTLDTGLGNDTKNVGSPGSIWFDRLYYSHPNVQSLLPYEGGSCTESDRRYSRSNRRSIHILRGMMAVWSENWSACTATSPFFLNCHVDYPCRYGHARATSYSSHGLSRSLSRMIVGRWLWNAQYNQDRLLSWAGSAVCTGCLGGRRPLI